MAYRNRGGVTAEPFADAGDIVHTIAHSRKSGSGPLSASEPIWSGANASGHFVEGEGRRCRLQWHTIHLSALDDLDLTRCDALKMDIMGSALNALAGAKSTIFGYQPRLLLSAYRRH